MIFNAQYLINNGIFSSKMHAQNYFSDVNLKSLDCTEGSHFNFRAGDTCLHCATREFHVEAIKLLVLNGADIYCSNHDGELPADFALEVKNTSLVSTLADKESKEAYLLDPALYPAVKKGETEQILALLAEKKKRRKKSRSSRKQSKETKESESSEPGTEKKKKRKRTRKSTNFNQQLLNAVMMWAAARMNLSLLDSLLDHPKINAG